MNETFPRAFRSEKLLAPTGASFFIRPNHLLPDCPVDLEIGCGVGWHAIRYAQNHPDRCLIAVERTQEKFQRFQSRYKNHAALLNLLPVHADVIPWTVHCLPNETLSTIFILYPNPYPKNPAARFLQMPFFAELLKKGKENLKVQLATNDVSYFEEARRLGTNRWGLKVANWTTLTKENFPSPRTHFEKKYLERGEVCYDLILER